MKCNYTIYLGVWCFSVPFLIVCFFVLGKFLLKAETGGIGPVEVAHVLFSFDEQWWRRFEHNSTIYLGFGVFSVRFLI